jgi:hypothetical protein
MHNDFVGGEEVLRMGNGAAYGLSCIQYWRLASCALACEKYAGIEPTTISPLADSAGCQLQLFGKKCLFEISVRPDIHLITLSVFPLDSSQERGIEAFSGSDSEEDFNRLTNLILRTDGLAGWEFLTYEEAVDYVRNQQIDV